jgi:hypothetical protein
MLGMAHPEFSSMFQRRMSAQRFAENQVADSGRDDANTSHAWVALYTLNFLNAYLKHDASAKTFLERNPAENGVPKHFMGITFSSRTESISDFTPAASYSHAKGSARYYVRDESWLKACRHRIHPLAPDGSRLSEGFGSNE